MDLKIKKIADIVNLEDELDVSAQSCDNDCVYYKTYSARAYKAIGKESGCKKVKDKRWTSWW